jgi:hypothetical protein
MSNQTTSREAAGRFISEFLQSKKSQKEFCRERNLNVGTFRWWLKRHYERPKKEKAPFIQLSPQKTIATVMSKESELTIEFQNGTRLKWRGIDIPMSFYELVSSLQTGVPR